MCNLNRIPASQRSNFLRFPVSMASRRNTVPPNKMNISVLNLGWYYFANFKNLVRKNSSFFYPIPLEANEIEGKSEALLVP